MSKKILKTYPIPKRPATAPGEITLTELNEQGNIKWVTHFHNLEVGGFYHGHYFTNLAEAEADFREQVKKFSGAYPNE